MRGMQRTACAPAPHGSWAWRRAARSRRAECEPAVNVTVVGTGYVGLVVAACLAETGNQVVSADVDDEKVAELQQNVLPIFEPGLAPLVERNQAAGRLQFTTRVAEAISPAEVIFIAVGTPAAEDGS